MDFGLSGKKAIVSGGSMGIGKAIARELAREGADVAIVSRTNDVLEAAASELSTLARPGRIGERRFGITVNCVHQEMERSGSERCGRKG